MTIESAHHAWPPLRRNNGTPEAMRALWRIYDIALLAIVLLVATEGTGRLGLQSPLWLLAYGLTVIRILLSLGIVLSIYRINSLFLVYPFVCATSVIWSALPEQSLVSAFQLFMTVTIGLVLGWRFSIERICIATFLMTAFTIALSLINWRTGMFGKIYADGGGLLGVFPQKNLLGKASLVCILSTVALFFIDIRPKILKKCAIVFGLTAPVLALILAKSTTPLLLLPLFIGLMLALNFRALEPFTRLAGLLGLGLIAATVPLLLELAGTDPITATLKATNKNTTLTGRTELWDIAKLVIERYWTLGVGFNAFWDAPRFAGLAYLGQQIGGENIRAFHNVILEVWVGTGVAGLFGLVLYMVSPLWRGVLYWWRSGGIAPAYALTISATLLVNAMINPSLYRQHELAVVMLAMFGAALAKALAEPGAAARQRA